jgi:hypothetical protein
LWILGVGQEQGPIEQNIAGDDRFVLDRFLNISWVSTNTSVSSVITTSAVRCMAPKWAISPNAYDYYVIGVGKAFRVKFDKGVQAVVGNHPLARPITSGV